MSVVSVVNILHWFVVVVVWKTGPWCTFHISGTFSTITQCIMANTQTYQSTSCCTNQWVHVVSKKFQSGCPPSDSSYALQSNTSQSLTVSCAGYQQSSSGSCSSGCLENVTAPDTYYGSNTTVTVETECIDESSIRNLCADLSDTPTDQLSLASPSLFLSPGPPQHPKCRCEIHAQHLHQVEILFADINTSMFTITCGQLIVSDGIFTTNVTNTVISLADISSDCVIEVDQRRADTTNGFPSHRVWANFTGSSITFCCNTNCSASTTSFSSSSPSSSSEKDTTMTIPPGTPKPTNQSSTMPLTSMSVSTFASHTASNETTQVMTTTNDTTTEGNGTTSQTTVDATTEVQVGETVPYPYIIAGVVGGVVLVIIIIIVVVIVVRKKRGGVKYATTGLHQNGDREETLPKTRISLSGSDPQCREDNSRVIMNAAYQPFHDQLHNNHYEVLPKKTKPQLHDGANDLSKSQQKEKSVNKTAKDRVDGNDDAVVMFDNDAYESFSSLQQQNIPDATRELDGEGSQKEADSLKLKSQPELTKSGDQHPLASTTGNTSSTKTWEDDNGDDETEMIVNDLYVSEGEIAPNLRYSFTSA